MRAPCLETLVPVFHARTEPGLCDLSDCIDIFLYSLGMTATSRGAEAQEFVTFKQELRMLASLEFNLVGSNLHKVVILVTLLDGLNKDCQQIC